MPSFFFTNRIGAPNGDLRRTDEASLPQFLELLLELGQLGGAQSDSRTARRRRPGYEFDPVVHLPRWRQTGRERVGEDVPVVGERTAAGAIEVRGGRRCGLQGGGEGERVDSMPALEDVVDVGERGREGAVEGRDECVGSDVSFRFSRGSAVLRPELLCRWCGPAGLLDRRVEAEKYSALEGSADRRGSDGAGAWVRMFRSFSRGSAVLRPELLCCWCGPAGLSDRRVEAEKYSALEGSADRRGSDGAGAWVRMFRSFSRGSAVLRPELLCCWCGPAGLSDRRVEAEKYSALEGSGSRGRVEVRTALTCGGSGGAVPRMVSGHTRHAKSSSPSRSWRLTAAEETRLRAEPDGGAQRTGAVDWRRNTCRCPSGVVRVRLLPLQSIEGWCCSSHDMPRMMS